ncbi:MAG: chromosome segregation protein SMC [Gammaproteobacteria bacterium]|nr:chromosome segregation protein SMC [Gammaproteobacteria bacterium]MCP5136937.1 chromosome segregation protein SMC [Gammaproteobacteria bacterium]
MRLAKIKLAGFKSFVDPTTIPLPSNLVGICGPNGCGKSNTIDAVRWVMGESSAKHLRGDSMADVIFNGSSSRKPVGQASVELVFDNSDGSLGGEYANYAEISIKRQVSRDGQSAYFLNNTRCRRRDITDVFLGTGLGPRSYAIIEQGTISRIIEARPEELRGYLEEAAGISKYKERRRETENRIRHTRENIERLDDLREEIGKQLQKLERQARTAERYKEYKAEERARKAELLVLRLRDLEEVVQRGERGIAEGQNALDALIAEQRNIEASLERERVNQTEASDQLNEVQGRYYAIGADVARTEQTIAHAKQLRARQEQELQQLRDSARETEEHLELDRTEHEDLAQYLAENEPRLGKADRVMADAADVLAELEDQYSDAQANWDDFTRRSAEPAQAAEVQKSRIEQLERQIHQAEQRDRRLVEEAERLDSAPLEAEIDALREEIELLAEDEAEANAARERAQTAIIQAREAQTELARELAEARREQQESRGRLSSLEALQQAALGKEEGGAADWLKAQGLDDAPRLAQQLRAQTGWETALETVLAQDLQAICVADLEASSDGLAVLSKGSVTLFQMGSGERGASNNGLEPLLDKVTAPWSLSGLLAGIHVADTVAEAFAQRGRLGVRESIVTRDGVWLGRDWLRVSREHDAHAGVLARSQEIETLQVLLSEIEDRVSELEDRQQTVRTELAERDAEHGALQTDAREAQRRLGDLRARLSGKEGRFEQIVARRARLQEDRDEAREQAAESREELAEAREQHSEAMAEMEALAVEREGLSRARDDLRARLDQQRGEGRRLRDAAHALALEVQSKRAAHQSLSQGLHRLEAQVAQQQERLAAVQAQLDESAEPIEEHVEQLELLLAQRLEVESELSGARSRVEEVDAAMRDLESRRGDTERKSVAARESVQELRLKQQESIVGSRTLAEALHQDGHDYQVLLATLPEDAREADWQMQVHELDARITRLGPINLAAIEEFEEQNERKTYLDAQHADLMEALETLESAIRKIDRETKQRFKDTFDKVNARLREVFPRLFGGGEAFLELTGEDLLDTGVAVMARPPGKRISTIHLMSGGEKALTAVALVFAIFELNPAPFCMLDEVDAPLDDANVGRFRRLVEEMSERVQIIFISHNKVAIEMAKQLTGVTMREPGVSRLVAVDVDEAVAMANA